MKKAITLLTALCLVFCLTAPALAAESVQALPSPQALVADGYATDCGKYSINDYNYFKLRDLAALLSGTGSQFSVGYDATADLVTIVTGEDYDFVGGELEPAPATPGKCLPTEQTILINGVERSDLSVYSIDDYNYFKLRDLGEALGFAVDYDPEWDTAVITSAPAASRIVKETHTEGGSAVTTTFTYDEAGRMTGYAMDNGAASAVYAYNDYGVLTGVRFTSGLGEDLWESETVYNGRGAVLSEASRSNWSTDTTTYTYDDAGVLTGMRMSSADGDFRSEREETYNAQGDIIHSSNHFAWSDGTEESSVTEYSFDAEGRKTGYRIVGSGITSSFGLDENGEWGDVLVSYSIASESSTVYEDGHSTETARDVWSYADGTDFVTDTVTENDYDANGNVITSRITSVSNEGAVYGEYWSEEYRYTYNDAGQLLTEACFRNGSDAPEYAETFTYDDAGRTLTDRMEYEDGSYHVMSYTYDAAGNCTGDSYEELYYNYDWETGETIPVMDRRGGTTQYNADGQPVLYTNDENGQHYERTLTYDDAGNLIREVVCVDGVETERIEYLFERIG